MLGKILAGSLSGTLNADEFWKFCGFPRKYANIPKTVDDADVSDTRKSTIWSVSPWQVRSCYLLDQRYVTGKLP